MTAGSACRRPWQPCGAGPTDFLIKPFQLGQLSRVLRSGFEQRRLRQENAELKAQLRERFRFDSIIGRLDDAAGVPNPRARVEDEQHRAHLRRDGHRQGAHRANDPSQQHLRNEGRFVAFNAAAIPALAEAELFGHTKGAFTGAVASRVGRFELAHRATLFIDEVGLMSLPLQAVLRALQEREIERVGESRPREVRRAWSRPPITISRSR
ncbi:MAG: sigma 54-interacting transcriptional regulator [Vicinamibacterales bacterium]